MHVEMEEIVTDMAVASIIHSNGSRVKVEEIVKHFIVKQIIRLADENPVQREVIVTRNLRAITCTQKKKKKHVRMVLDVVIGIVQNGIRKIDQSNVKTPDYALNIHVHRSIQEHGILV